MGLSASRTLENQRRRRLVMETGFDGPARSVTRNLRVDLTDGEESSGLSLSLADCIPSQRWAYWAVGVVSSAVFVSMLVAWILAEEASASGSMVADKIVLLTSRMLSIVGACFWLAAGQLSCLVWWGRSQSRVDYSGRFHAWGWAAAGFAVAGLFAVVGTPQLASIMLDLFGGDSASSPRGVTAIWLLPSLVIGLAFWATLGIELRGSLASRILHGLAAASGVAFWGIELWLSRSEVTVMLECGSKLSLAVLQWCNLMTVLLQVHHVVHVSPDPSEVTPTLWSVTWERGPVSLIKWLGTRLRKLVISGRTKQAVEVRSEISESEQVTNLSPHTESKKRRMRLEAADGTAQEVRIDDAEQLAKGPTRRERKVARKA